MDLTPQEEDAIKTLFMNSRNKRAIIFFAIFWFIGSVAMVIGGVGTNDRTFAGIGFVNAVLSGAIWHECWRTKHYAGLVKKLLDEIQRLRANQKT